MDLLRIDAQMDPFRYTGIVMTDENAAEAFINTTLIMLPCNARYIPRHHYKVHYEQSVRHKVEAEYFKFEY